LKEKCLAKVLQKFIKNKNQLCNKISQICKDTEVLGSVLECASGKTMKQVNASAL